MITEKQKIIVIVGPTASGKTSLSIEIAKQIEGEVISSDSRQVYKRLDIGTEKVSKDEMNGIPHHLIDMVEPDTVYTAADFKRDANKAITDITTRGKVPIIAGGTFFYVDVLLERISTPEVAPNPSLRAELETKSAKTLYESLLKLDPKRAATIDPDNKRRLMRALEVVSAIGNVPEKSTLDCPYDVLIIGIKTDKEELRTRLRSRAEEALTRGLIDETKDLLSNNISCERLSEIGLEYRIVMEYLDGSLTEEALIKKLEEKNWQYAKRQLTWLKRDDSIEWFLREDREAILARVKTFLSP